MDRVFESGAIGSAPSAPASPSSGYPTAGNPSTATPATKPGPYWFHQVTEELRAVIVGAGLTPSHTDLDQLKEAIDTLINAGKGLGSSGIVLLNATTTLTNASHVGKTVLFDGTATGAFTVTLPLANTVTTGRRIHFQNVSSFNVTVQRQGSNVIYPNGASVNSIIVGPGDTLTVEAYNGTSWFAVGGSNQLGAAASFMSSLSTNGYQKLPSGLIKQWGTTSLGAVGAYNAQTIGGIVWYSHFYTVTLPIAYNTAHFDCVATLAGYPGNAQGTETAAFVKTNKTATGPGESLTSFTVSILTPATGWTPTIHWESTGA